MQPFGPAFRPAAYLHAVWLDLVRVSLLVQAIELAAPALLAPPRPPPPAERAAPDAEWMRAYA